ncbi:MAG: RDD family protein [Thiobacillaceae bacterium]
MQQPPIAHPPASIRRRLASMFYEAVLLTAVWVSAGFLFLALHKDVTAGGGRLAFQLYLIVVTGVYCVTFWRWGQTLPMKTWRIQLVDRRGRPPGAPRALLRYLFAIPSVCLLGAGLFWALADKDRQFLHDRMAGLWLVDTRLGNQSIG